MLSEDKISNGVAGYNSTSINVAYIGGVDTKNKCKPIDNRTDEQKQSLIKILTELKKKYPNAHIMGHRDIWGKDKLKWKKACPCFDAEEEYSTITGEEKQEPKPEFKPSVPNSPLKPKSLLDKIKELAPWNQKK